MLEVERAAELHLALQKLGNMDTRTLHAFYFEGLSLQQISEHENCPLRTVKRRLYDARKRLHVLLANEDSQINSQIQLPLPALPVLQNSSLLNSSASVNNPSSKSTFTTPVIPEPSINQKCTKCNTKEQEPTLHSIFSFNVNTFIQETNRQLAILAQIND